ncbi:MAG: hypothetical protein AAGD04_08095 [Pseudomonadota bacterium]
MANAQSSSVSQDESNRAPIVIAIFLSAIWILAIVSFFTLLPTPLPMGNWVEAGMMAVAAITPICVFWLAATSAVAVRRLRSETEHLRASVAALSSVSARVRAPEVVAEETSSQAPHLRLEPDVEHAAPPLGAATTQSPQASPTGSAFPDALRQAPETSNAPSLGPAAAQAMKAMPSLTAVSPEPEAVPDPAREERSQAPQEYVSELSLETPEPALETVNEDQSGLRFSSKRDARGLHPSGSLIGRGAPAPAAETQPDAAEETANQPTLAFETEEEAAPVSVLSNDDLLRALHFPKDADDITGFAALRRALKDNQASALIQAAQDILTLLSQEGIYMDDLTFDRPRPDLWRRFAKGERGPALSALGGVRDRASLALTAQKMREDTIFRDTAHHFLRRFDKSLMGFEPNMSDTELTQLSVTRSALAFMLLGRVAGVFQ